MTPLPHAELEAMLTQAVTAADTYEGVTVNGFGIQCNPPSCTHAFVWLDQPAPEYEAEMRERFGGRIVFEYGRPTLL
jgi:hypothetical protein